VTKIEFEPTREFASEMDARDPLAGFRARFHIPKNADGADGIYLCGHSLGLQPKTVAGCIEEELKDWADLGVEGHFRAKRPWMPYHRFLTAQMAEVVGAKPGEVVVMNSLTVNLHLLMVSFYRPTRERHKILIESGAFPSDRYAVISQIKMRGLDPTASLLELKPRPGQLCLREEDILELIRQEGDSIALVLLPGVNYATGQVFDLESITAEGHAKACMVGFDLAHAAGNLRLQLHDSGADFAAWCNYKYLNGGPGCIAACFVHERHANSLELPRFAGWWGHDQETRFQMGPDFRPMEGAEGWQLSNPPILALAALRASLELFEEAGMERLRAKSIVLTDYLRYLLERSRSSAFSIVTPREPERRGAQLSLRIAVPGRTICERLQKGGVTVDWREPDTIRVAPVPFYNRFADVHEFVQVFDAVMR
jgi:kynureninase